MARIISGGKLEEENSRPASFAFAESVMSISYDVLLIHLRVGRLVACLLAPQRARLLMLGDLLPVAGMGTSRF